jgi:hypothetical protein
MRGDHIKYRGIYKYQLAEDYKHLTAITPPVDIVTEYIVLTIEGWMTQKKGYAWDGCSGPTKDDKTNMRGGCGHDGKYQLIRLGLISPDCRIIADRELRQDCLDDGMWKIRAWYYFEGVDHFAMSAAKYGSDPYPVQVAP